MNAFKHIKRLLKSINKRVIQPVKRLLKPIIRWLNKDPYEISLIANKDFEASDFAVVRDVLSYEHCNFNSWKIKALSPGYQSGTGSLRAGSAQIYIAIDTVHHDAFGHWFFESAIWLPKLKNILDAYPNSKIYSTGPRGYKTQIFEYFGISPDRVVTEFSEKNNVCLFVNPCTSINDLTEHDKFREMLVEFSKQFHQTKVNKEIDYLLMPRQKTGNYIPNNRDVNTDDLESYLENIPKSKIFNTDTSPTFADQIEAVQTCKNLLVADGSAFLVNAFLAKNSVVIVLGDALVPNQRRVQEKLRILCEHIEHNNAVMYVHSPSNIFTRESINQWVKS
jgi:hypothetical protein